MPQRWQLAGGGGGLRSVRQWQEESRLGRNHRRGKLKPVGLGNCFCLSRELVFGCFDFCVS